MAQPTGRGAQGPRKFSYFCHKCRSIKCAASALTRPASQPQQRACAHVYADAVLPVQYIQGEPKNTPTRKLRYLRNA